MLTKDDVIYGKIEYRWDTEYPLYNDAEVYEDFLKNQLDSTGICILDETLPMLLIEEENIVFEVTCINNDKYTHILNIDVL